MQSVLFFLFYIIAKPLSLLPLPILYLLSDFLFFIVYYVFGYRKKVVMENLKNAFPNKTDEEKALIAKKFYHNLCDFIIEALKMLSISTDELKKRMKSTNPEAINSLFKKNKNVISVSGHTINWEWILILNSFLEQDICAIYQPLKNKHFDKMFKKIRGRYGATLVSMRKTYSHLYRKYQAGELFGACMVSDQSPPSNYNYWTMFMNQETAVYTGVERIAKRTDAAVVFISIKKIKRGYYENKVDILFESTKDTPEYEITRTHTKHLERLINEQPETYLWSHRRWKHKRQDGQQLHI